MKYVVLAASQKDLLTLSQTPVYSANAPTQHCLWLCSCKVQQTLFNLIYLIIFIKNVCNCYLKFLQTCKVIWSVNVNNKNNIDSTVQILCTIKEEMCLYKNDGI